MGLSVRTIRGESDEAQHPASSLPKGYWDFCHPKKMRVRARGNAACTDWKEVPKQAAPLCSMMLECRLAPRCPASILSCACAFFGVTKLSAGFAYCARTPHIGT